MATTKITKKLLEQKLMNLLDNPTFENNDGEIERMTAMEITAKVSIIKQLCNMRGYNAAEKKEITNKNIVLKF